MKKITVFSVVFVSLFMFLSQVSWAEILPESTVAVWLFDEGNGNTASDSTGNGHDGEIKGATWGNGRFGEALSLDGTNDWVSIPHSEELGFAAGQSFSITLHFKGSKVGGSLFGKGFEDKSEARPWYLLWNNGKNGKVRWYLRSVAAVNASFHTDDTSDIADDEWHFIAAVADASTGKISIWIDGIKEAEDDFDENSGYGTNTDVIAIGRHYNRYTRGIIDDVGLFNVALTEDQIQTIRNAGLSAAITPRLHHVAPAFGSNDKVNVAIGQAFTVEVGSDDPYFPDATIIEYQWQKQRVGINPLDVGWETTHLPSKEFRQTSEGEFSIYARMVDSNDLATLPIGISVKVWPQANVSSAAGESAQGNWYEGKYVGVTTEEITLQAVSVSDPVPSESNRPDLTTSSKVGTGARQFNGTDLLPTDQTTNQVYLVNKSLTVAAWIKRDRSSSNDWVISQGEIRANSPNKGLHFGFKSDNQFAFAFYLNDLNVPAAANVPTQDVTGWHHWVGTYNYDTASGQGVRKVYVDGQEVATQDGIDPYQGSGPFWIGRAIGDFQHYLQQSWRSFFQGKVDDIAIFNRALTLPEIIELMDGIKGAKLKLGLVYFNTFDYEGVSRYHWSTAEGDPLATQVAGNVVNYTWTRQNLNGSITAQPINHVGIEGDSQSFDLKIYPELEIFSEGPFVGKPNRPVTLKGSINNHGYPGAEINYQWSVEKESTSVEARYVRVELSGSKYLSLAEVEVFETDSNVNVAREGTATQSSLGWGGVPERAIDGITDGNWRRAGGSTVTHTNNVNPWWELDLGETKFVHTVTIWNRTDGGLGFRLRGFRLKLLDENNDTVWEITTSASEVPSPSAVYSMTTSVDPSENWIEIEPPDSQANYSWTQVGQTEESTIINAKLAVNIITTEGVSISGNHFTTVKLSAGVPTAEPGGPYRQAIEGGNFSPVQLTGNLPNVEIDEDIGTINDWEWSVSRDVGGTLEDETIEITGNGTYNPTIAFTESGTYHVSLRVQSELGKWSPEQTTTVTVIDGKIEGQVKAADLRTAVEDVTITLTSLHVPTYALSRIASKHGAIGESLGGELTTTTNSSGKYSFPNLPLGSYTLTASKVEESGIIHEFETSQKTTELTMDAPNQTAIDYTDLSVYPVGGQIYYSILKNGQKVRVENVEISAQPVGTTSAITALGSTKSPDAKGQNYSLPIFAGEYLFKPQREGHEIRLVGTQPSSGTAEGSTPSGYDPTTQLVTIEGGRTDIDFVDYTTRTITVFVEDSGGFPIETYSENQIEVEITGTNGSATGQVINDLGKTSFSATIPPGKYTISLPNVSTAIVKGDSSLKQAEVDVTGTDGNVTMVVPVQIQLDISPTPTLIAGDLASEFGLTDADNPEGFMFYYAGNSQEHTYIITATANGQNVADFSLEVTNDISQESFAPAPTITYTTTEGPYYKTTRSAENMEFAGEYTFRAGIPKATVVDESNPATYVETKSPNGESVKVPKVEPKSIRFKARKDGYQESEEYTLKVTVLGDMPEGSAAEIFSIPNINYLVLHDPPGDGSYSYLEDSMTIKGLLGEVSIKVNDTKIPVYPSPWSSERYISDGRFFEDNVLVEGAHGGDLASRGLLGYKDSDPATTHFVAAAAAEALIGAGIVVTGPLGYGLQFLKIGVTTALFNFRDLVQYEVSPNRMIRTPSEDDLPDKMGPGKGDIYYGEGWTLGLQTKYRFSVERIPPIGGSWTLTTRQILTYDILDVKNQYVYTVTDIERIIADLDKTLLNKGIAKNVSALSLEQAGEEEELKRLVEARQNWKNLLQKNPAYVWRKDHVLGGKDSSRTALDQFREEKFTAEDNKGELIIFSGGGEFEYSRTITETNTVEFSSSVSLSSTSSFSHEAKVTVGLKFFGSGAEEEAGSGSEASIGSSQDFTKARESGTESEQTVGFVLADGDAWDSYSTYVHEGPWGTPIFFTDPGSVTSWPWEQGTVKGVDVELSQGEGNDGPFDYRQGAHYKFTVTSRGVAVKESSGFDFIIYDVPTDNPNSATVKFNANGAPYKIELAQSTANVIVSIYPPERDWKNAAEMEYPVMVQAESAGDYQIAVNKVLKPRFADLRAPRATVTAPYDGQRISPTLFTTDGFKIEAFSDDEDIDRIQLQIRTLQPDGVYQPWQHLTGMLWQNGEANANVTVVPYIERDPERREFTFSWAPAEIQALGVGEYQLRAVAKDAATRLSPDGITQTASPSTDLDPPIVMFRVDDSPPTVLTTIPFYQDKDAARIYHGELSATFNDDMRSTDFSDRTFEVIDLLNNAPPVGGFVSYSPALRKAVFVPVTPFNPNGFYKATINSSVHDLAGNALKSEFSWTFRTTDSPFEETWSIILSATDGDSTDGNNIASVEFGAEEGEDAKDARALTAFGNQLALSFIDDQLTEFDRDTRPADGRLSHHWFSAVKHATGNVTLSWKPSSKLIQSAAQRQYKELRLVEFIDEGGTPTQQTISLDPSVARDSAGLPEQTDIYTYTPATGELVRYFRLDVMKRILSRRPSTQDQVVGDSSLCRLRQR